MTLKREDTTVSPPVLRTVAADIDVYVIPRKQPDEILFTGETIGDKYFDVIMDVVQTDIREGDVLEESSIVVYMILEVNTFVNNQQLVVVQR